MIDYKHRASALLAAAMVLVGCATQPTPYRASHTDPYGYTDEAVGTNRVRVGFRGNTATSEKAVESALFRRMVEIANEYRAGSFSVADVQTDCVTTLRTSPTTTCTYRQPTDAMFPFYFGVYEIESPWHASPRREYEAVATIELFDQADCTGKSDCFVTEAASATLAQ